ncbi:hypothetical protein THERMOS_1400 [Bathymodiolus thermophilus thioautotrophic gill symbiont]|uniref:Uncharacterized protein n=1 Tax=Bathymodiolus thermophilus thioautotrophic gill symbiont TaxID=2360 RepID=A0A8H8XCC6_9GAMM|nr:hypothetical protein THERMOS_1400 [Bathymodiolus thermophilus thioautotrophic gill symbiont]
MGKGNQGTRASSKVNKTVLTDNFTQLQNIAFDIYVSEIITNKGTQWTYNKTKAMCQNNAKMCQFQRYCY